MRSTVYIGCTGQVNVIVKGRNAYGQDTMPLVIQPNLRALGHVTTTSTFILRFGTG